MIPDWESVLGSNKNLIGFATSAGELIGDMSSWSNPKIHITRLVTNEEVLEAVAVLNLATGEFNYSLDTNSLENPGIYEVRFSALDPNGGLHYFPEGNPKYIVIRDN